MLSTLSQEILEKYQVRKSAREKRAFRAWLRAHLEEAGWSVTEDHAALSGTSVIAGDPDKAKVFFTAHYDTQAVLPFPNFITPRSLGWYLLYNLLVFLGFLIVNFLVSLLGAMLGVALGTGPLFAYLFGYLTCVFCLWWMLFGKANRHTVNDNTSGVITLLETALSLPPEDRDRVCLLFFDNEERGMLGSNHFASHHKAVKANGLILNFDCVSDGDSIQFFPSKALKGEEAILAGLEAAFAPAGGKTVEVVRGFGFYPSDNASFRRSCGVCALKKSKTFGWYMDRIHTRRDTVMDERNIALLVSGNLALARSLPNE